MNVKCSINNIVECSVSVLRRNRVCSHKNHTQHSHMVATTRQQDNVMLCPQCDMLAALPPLVFGTKALCPRCKTTLSTYRNEPRVQPISYALSALLMLPLANIFPFINMHVANYSNEIKLLQAPEVLVADNYSSLAMLFIVFVQLIPAFCMLAIILLYTKVYIPLPLKSWIAKMLFQCKTWCMVEIFLAGVLISFVKLMAYGNIGIGNSFIPYCLYCLLQVRALQCIDRRWLWQDIQPAPNLGLSLTIGCTGMLQGMRSCGCCTSILPTNESHCTRCNSIGYVRRRDSLKWTLALLLTSFILYILANLLPIMVTELLGSKIQSTIIAGVFLLWEEGSYSIAIVIFIASIMIPSLKMLAISWRCWDAYNNSKKHANSKRIHLIYNLLTLIGRWSMIDVFVIGILSTLVRMGQLMNIYPDIGSVLFALVVILTMLATMTLDPRLTWDCRNEMIHKELKGDETQ